MRTFLLTAAAGIWVVLIRGRAGGLSDGLPLDRPLELTLAGLVIGLLLVVRWKPLSWKVVLLFLAGALVLGVAKEAVGFFSLPHGLLARYYGNRTGPLGVPDRSLGMSQWGVTRLDREIAFRDHRYQVGQPSFPLGFLNDVTRYNLAPPRFPKDARKRMPFHVVWEGFVRVPGPVDVTLVALGEARVWVNGERLVGVEASGSRQERSAPVQLPAGLYPVRVSFTHPGGLEKAVQLLWSQPGRPRRVIPAAAYFPSRPSARRLAWDDRLGWGAWVVNAAAVAWLAGLLGMGVAWGTGWRGVLVPGRAAQLGLILGSTLIGVGFLLARVARDPNWATLSPTDYHLYETDARYIVSTGDWMDRPAGAFHNNPLMRYALAVAHLLVGEDLFLVAVLQHLLGGVTCALVQRVGAVLFQPRVGWTAGLLTAVNKTVIDWGHVFYVEKLAIALVTGGVWAVLRTTRAAMAPGRPRGAAAYRHSGARGWLAVQGAWGWALTAGVVWGLAVLARPNLLVVVPVVLVWVWGVLGWTRRGLAIGLAVAGPVLGAVGLVTWRNYAVSGTPVVICSEGPINLLMANRPPPLVDLSDLATGDPAYDRWLAAVFEGRYFEDMAPGGRYEVLNPLLLRAVARHWQHAPGHFARGVWERAQGLWWRGKEAESGLPYVAAYVLGTVPAFRRRNWREILLVHLVLLAFTAGLLPFLVKERFLMPVRPLLILWAAYVLCGLGAAVGRWMPGLRHRSWRTGQGVSLGPPAHP